MYDVIKNVIISKRYELLELLNKIDVLWVQGDLTDDQRVELIALAQKYAQVENSIDIMSKLGELDKRVKDLEVIVFAPETVEPGEGEDPGESEEPVITHPEYEAGEWYYTGNIVTFNGGVYECIAPEGFPCVWSPADYPAYWQAVVVDELPEEEPEEPEVEPTEPEVEPTEPEVEPEVPEEEVTQEPTE